MSIGAIWEVLSLIERARNEIEYSEAVSDLFTPLAASSVIVYLC